MKTETQSKPDGGSLDVDAGFGVWKPIETAPRGKEVLMFQPQEKAGQMMLSERIIVDRAPCAHFRATTHWMPLPASPNDRNEPRHE